MEVYTLDSLYRREEMIEDHESLIWTERYAKYGDFELHIASTRRTRALLKADACLSMSESDRPMRIKTVEDSVDADNRKMLVAKGRSFESMMYDRVAKESLSNLTTSPSWKITGLTPTAVARKIFHDICVTGVLSPYDIIPFIHEGSSLVASNISEPSDIITVEIEPTTVYDAIANLAEIWDFGFRILRQDDDSKLWFDVYMGSDRTTGQATLPAVVFSPQLDNLQNTTQLTTVENAKNVAYVYSPGGFQMVYADDVDTDVSGFDRRVMVIKADDITVENYPVPADLTAALMQKGKEELAKARTYQAFDGEISQVSQYKPGVDYNLGDLVEMRDYDGVTNEMRVTEIIYASDSEGERSYPSLTMNKFINSGSWLSWLNNKEWVEMDDEKWADQP